MDQFANNWVNGLSKEQKEKAEKNLQTAKEMETNNQPPEGYKYVWVDGPIRTKKRVLVKIDDPQWNTTQSK